MKATIRLGYPPSINTYWRGRVVLPRSWLSVLRSILPPSMRGRASHWCLGKGLVPTHQTYISKEGQSYRLDVQAAILQRFGVLKPLACRLGVTLDVCCPDRRQRDLDNVCKAALDALTHARVWADDKLIDRLTIVRGPVVKGGLLVVTIERLDSGKPVQRELALARREEVA